MLRGTVFEPKLLGVCDAVEEEFGYAEIHVVSLEDLYAGKICAALDRQHPRDLFDVKLLLENEGLTKNLRKALIVYIISHSRSIVELLNPIEKDISDLYEGEFKDMENENTSLEDLEKARSTLIKNINQGLSESEKEFLLSFKNKNPNWNKLELNNIDRLPAVRWKLQNLNKMKPEKHISAYKKLENHLLE